MMDEKIGSAEVLERLMSSYGVTTQKSLAESLDIPANNISGWTQRGSVPGNAIIKCALDTGADLQWLMTGELANASFRRCGQRVSGKELHEQILASGGKAVLRRMLDAYGFKTQKELGDLLSIASGTISTWVRRDYFPGDVVITCALDTVVSLEWLATGKVIDQSSTVIHKSTQLIPRKDIVAGVLKEAGHFSIDLGILPQTVSEPVYVFNSTMSWLLDCNITDISNGRWMLGIDGKYDIYDISLLPGKKINVANKISEFICGIDEVEVSGKVLLTLNIEL